MDSFWPGQVTGPPTTLILPQRCDDDDNLGHIEHIQSRSDCQAICQSHTGCAFFSHSTDVSSALLILLILLLLLLFQLLPLLLLPPLLSRTRVSGASAGCTPPVTSPTTTATAASPGRAASRARCSLPPQLLRRASLPRYGRLQPALGARPLGQGHDCFTFGFQPPESSRSKVLF